ncbi:MAG: hypothetical protein A2057_04780 [Ignavibacteria bacterium GWA2_35_9]|nr:MAG: hypothetical protein A2057_04780 [Ignavibacteria bacterium GWA2_35_9]OGU47914.1 MAG: hypothetical protein A2000_14645 [Ignavibacteria bacterium GWB2_36_8]OGU48747.1 MAG: hypothetical protein A2080_05895 [Ignavibacteria bacterium GWC2_36_12]
MNISYVLLTAAKNEEKYIRQTIESIVSQKILPEKWVIVSDASTDSTDDIIQEYAYKFSFIQYVRATDQSKRDFASKTFALNIGYKYLKDLDYNFIGFLDADVTFSPIYYETILNKFLLDLKLGVAGGIFYDVYDGKRHKIPISYHSVGGAVQLFRRKCYEDIGGLVPLISGGIDTYAEISARQYGWKVRTFDDAEILHHRRTGTAATKLIRYKFRQGIVEYSLGYYPLFQGLKCVGRLVEKPYIIGALLRFSGFWWATFKKEKRTVSKDFLDYVRKEQKERFRNIFLLKKENI